MLRTLPVALGVLLSAGPPLAQIAPQPQPKFSTQVTIVEVAASVRDGDGRFVPGLARKDFELKVDGRAVPIESFAAVSAAPARPVEGRFIVLLFDDMATTPTLLSRMKEIALNIVDRMGPFDEAAVLATNGDAMTTTTDRDQIRARIRGLEPFNKVEPMPRQSTEQAFRTLTDLSTQVAPVERRRKVIVVIGSSGLFDKTKPSPLDPPQLEQAWFDAARAAARHNVAVYIIDPRGLSQPDERGDRFSGAAGFAGQTGGLAFTNTNNFKTAIDRIWSDIGSYYLLGYAAPEAKGRKEPGRLSVRVKRPGVEVQARRTAG